MNINTIHNKFKEIFNKKAIGLDIADRTIEVVELEKRGSDFRISSLGRIFLEKGIVDRGRIKKKEKLAGLIKQAFLKAKPRPIVAKEVIFGLPESQVYIHIFELDTQDKKRQDEIVFNEIQRNIPLRKDDLLFSYKVISEKEGKAEIISVAASKEVVEEWQQFFRQLKVKVKIFDIESLAVFRGLFTKKIDLPICLVDIGAATTNVAIFDAGGLAYSHSIKIAGDNFTQELAEILKIDLEKAETKKRKVGISSQENRVFPILIKSLEPLWREIKKIIDYFEEKNKRKIREIVLAGGSSKMKGIVDYFRVNSGLTVKIGKSKLLKRGKDLDYLEAVGLALRGMDEETWDERDPAIRLTEGGKREKSEKLIRKISLAFLILKGKKDLDTREYSSRLRKLKNILIVVLILGLVLIGISLKLLKI